MSTRVRMPVRLIKRVVTRQSLGGYSEARANLVYWRSRNPSERVAAVEHLRRTHIGRSARLQRVVRTFQRSTDTQS